MSWSLYALAKSRPPLTRRRRLVWCVALLLFCVPMAAVSTYAAVTAWDDVIGRPDVPPWLEDEVASAADAVLATVLALVFGTLSVFLLVVAVRGSVPGASSRRRPE